MAGRNNTTPIGDGSVGLDTQDGVGREIQRAVSENNLKYQIGQNSSVKGVFNATVRMVSRWQKGDKYRILQEYGNVQAVGKNPSDDELDQAVATTLISNMPKEDLKRIVGSEEAKQTKLAKDVQANNAKAISLGKKYFNMGSAASLINQAAGKISDPRQALKLIKQQDKDFKLDKKFGKQNPRLKKQIISILKGMTKQEIAEYAIRMDLELEDNSAFKTVSNMIAITVVMYASLILGDSKGISPSQFTPEAVSAIEELLLMTDFAYITGKAGIGDLEIANKRKKAIQAKKQLEQNKQIAKENAKYLKFKKNGQTKLKKGLLGTAKNKFFKKNVQENTEFLNNKSEDEIRDLARIKGIPDADTGKVEDLKNKLAEIMAGENKSILDQQKKALKIKDPQKRKEAMDRINAAKKGSVAGAAYKMSDKATQDYSDKIPVVTFNQDGKLASEGILKAVPVFIAGTAEKVGKIQEKEQAKLIKDEDEQSENTKIDEYFKNLSRKGLNDSGQIVTKESEELINAALKRADTDEKWKNKIYNKNSSGKLVAKSNQEILDLINEESSTYKTMTEEQKKYYDSMSVKTGSPIFVNKGATEAQQKINSEIEKNMKSFNEAKVQATLALKDPKAKYHDFKVGQVHREGDADLETFYGNHEQIQDDIKKGKAIKVSLLKGRVSEIAEEAFLKLDLNNEPTTKVIPVIDLNRSHDYIGSIKDDVAQSTSYLGAIMSSLDNLTYMWSSLQSAGLSMNMASAGGILGIANTAANIASDVIGAHFATGGSMKGRNFVSNIITGDDPRNRNNTELVSVDWQHNNIDVKPIPKMATGGKVGPGSNIDNVHRMTSNERGKPLGVGIESGIVHYSKQLSDVQDDNSGTALKVYSVNSGVHDKVKIGDTEMSMFDAVYGIFTSVASISENIAQSNQLLSAISSNTSMTNQKLSKINKSESGGAFSFTNELNTILSGE